MKIVFIRHGKTLGNETGLYIGCKMDEALSEAGEKATRECQLYRAYADPKGRLIFTSPMLRARQTAKLLFGDEGRQIDDITEMDFGDFEGKNYKLLNGNPDYQRWIDSGGEGAFPNGESRSDFVKRSMEGFKQILRLSMEEETVIVVCHGGTIMAVLSCLTGEDYYSFQVKNLEGFELTIDKPEELLKELENDGKNISHVSYNCINLGDNT